MNSISKSTSKVDHFAKISGSSKYVADLPTTGVYFGRLVRSTVARAKLLAVHLPSLPSEYFFYDAADVPGDNNVNIVFDDTPVFAAKTVEYIGDPIGILVGPCERTVNKLLDLIKVDYELLEPIFDPLISDTTFFNVNINKGDVATAFATADKIYEETFNTGLQEQAYMETNGVIASYEDGQIVIRGSLQCPYYIHGAVARAMAMNPKNIRVIQEVTGGGFGGKEDFPNILSCQAAVATYHCNKPVRIIFDRQEDILGTSKRHPSHCTYRVALKDNKIVGMDIDVLYDAGAYTTLSLVVLQRGVIAACGVYNIENLKVRGQANKTNIVPSGAFRGFGGPQTFFAVEMMMNHIAKDLGLDEVQFKLEHLVRQGDITSTSGRYHFPVPLKSMTHEILADSDYYSKREVYKNQTGRYRRGIGLSMVFHGCGFTGNGERDKIKSVVQLHKSSDGYITILTANTDMGQGLLTTFSKIIAHTMNIPMGRIIINLPDTNYVLDSGPTIASRSIMIVGELIRRAALRLKDEWQEGKEQLIEERYTHPKFMIPFNNDLFTGDAYPTFAWSTNVTEVIVDTFTGKVKVVGAWGNYDVGTPIDEQIVIGQMEGGLIQSLGYAVMEEMAATKVGFEIIPLVTILSQQL
jgi:CO/xanthine dehydrogenase Mo-binding subunit